MSVQPGKRILLLVEDSAADVQILERLLRDVGQGVALRVTRDGQEAMDYLLRQGPYATDPSVRFPDLVLLDLHLPRLTGLEVLKRVRALPELRHVPVVVWTTSQEEEDIRAVYLAGANSYIEKPRDYARYREVLEIMLRYWFQIAQLPASPDSRTM